MTADSIPLLVTTGVGVGVLAGVISGVFYLITNGVNIGRRFKYSNSINRSLSIENLNKLPTCSSCNLITESFCSLCNLPLCKDCNASNKPGISHCLTCISERDYHFDFINNENEGLFQKFINEAFNFSFSYLNNSNLNRVRVSRPASGNKLHESSNNQNLDEKGTKVREYLQQMAETFTGGSLDQVSVSRMYGHPEYLPVINSEPIANTQAKLQQLVQRVIEEALRLPALLDYSGIHRDNNGRLPDFNPKTYEDLLATAILNKVIDRYQQEALANGKGGASSSGVHSGSSSPAGGREIHRRSRSSRSRLLDSSPDRSSLEPASHDDYDHSDSSGRTPNKTKLTRKYSASKDLLHSSEDEGIFAPYENPVDGALANINFNKKNRIAFPEFGGDIVEIQDSIDKDSGDFSFHSDDIYTNNNSWEENWLFQKRKIKTTQSVSVPMLVPSSNIECRAMIGDKEVDDTSDLSDAASDIELEHSNDIKQVLIDSKTVIGGKNSEILAALIEDTDDNHNNTKDVTRIVTNEIESIIFTNGHIDENENLESFMIQETVTNGNEEMGKHAEITEFIIEEKQLSKNDAIIELLQNLESEDISYPIKQTEIIEDLCVNEATNLDVVGNKDNDNHDSLGSHQQESEYTETIARPVQRHMDSLKRQHNIKTKPKEFPEVTENESDHTVMLVPAARKINSNNAPEISLPETIPGTIADREHKKWLNAVPMENNPYSPEAIKNRLNKQNQSLIFDILSNPQVASPQDFENKENLEQTTPTKSPKPLQEVFSENMPEYKRYGRDYYINQSKNAAGTRKKLHNEFNFDSSLSVDNDVPAAVTPFNSCDLDEIDAVSRDTSKVIDEITIQLSPQNTNDDLDGVKPQEDEIYHCKQIMIEDIDNDNEFEDIYEKAIKIENGDHDIYMLPVNTNDEKTAKLLQQTNGILIQNGDITEQSDSFNSSIDDSPRIYNIQSGKILQHSLSNTGKKESLFRSHEDLVLPSSIKSWKSMNDVCWENKHDKDIHKIDLRIDENLELPSVKALAEKFFFREKQSKPIVKPKRRISRELLDNDLVNKSLSDKQTPIKHPIHMHSLTARSISKEFRDELKMSMPEKTAHPGGSKYVPNGTNGPIREGKTSQPGSPTPKPGSLRNKLAFFEKISKVE